MTFCRKVVGNQTLSQHSLKNHYYTIMENVMSFTKNETVIAAWKNGQSAQGHSLHTDGNALYSDRLLIGYTGGNVRTTKRVIEYKTVSKKVSRAVNLAEQMGVKAVKPIGE